MVDFGSVFVLPGVFKQTLHVYVVLWSSLHLNGKSLGSCQEKINLKISNNSKCDNKWEAAVHVKVVFVGVCFF